jgi:hypothetical protein
MPLMLVDHAARRKETMAMIRANASQVRYAVGLGARRRVPAR